MNKRWEMMQEPELVPASADPRIYKQLIAEIAEILYNHFASSQKNTDRPLLSSAAPDLLSQFDSTWRSGTNG
jgi:hypothetical protein